MSCKQCEIAQESGYKAYYRWKAANIELAGCPEHIKEVMTVLNDYQRGNFILKENCE